MNKLLLIFTMIAIVSCGSVRNMTPVSKGPNMMIKQDGKEEYEITIIDPDFDTWFATNSKPANYYPLSYYEQKNRQYVLTWNERVDEQAYYPLDNYPFENRINYDPTIDYGLEVNYKLYYYFKYIESIYGRRYDFHA